VKIPASGVLPHRLGPDFILLKIGEEAVDDAALASLVMQRLADLEQNEVRPETVGQDA
jgi:uncharacterized membrane protein YkvA (DUF1232 family)